nr:MAG TPA: hypothetical protein [Caudoviricetes sp.]
MTSRITPPIQRLQLKTARITRNPSRREGLTADADNLSGEEPIGGRFLPRLHAT